MLLAGVNHAVYPTTAAGAGHRRSKRSPLVRRAGGNGGGKVLQTGAAGRPVLIVRQT